MRVVRHYIAMKRACGGEGGGGTSDASAKKVMHTRVCWEFEPESPERCLGGDPQHPRG